MSPLGEISSSHGHRVSPLYSVEFVGGYYGLRGYSIKELWGFTQLMRRVSYIWDKRRCVSSVEPI